MNLIKGPLPEKIDISDDAVIQHFKTSFRQSTIHDSIDALIFYGSRLFGNRISDYDMDLILKAPRPEDYQVIRTVVDSAKKITAAPIDFELYYADELEANDRFTTGSQGCYFLYSWACGEAIIGSNGKFKEALATLSPDGLRNSFDKKIKYYFARVRHILLNEPFEPRVKEIKKNLTRAIFNIDLLLEHCGYEKFFGHSTDSILTRELKTLSVCTPDMVGPLEKLLTQTITCEESFALVNTLHKRYISLVQHLPWRQTSYEQGNTIRSI